ncbi:MAG TPA: NAD(P)H-binding protein, partial [Myxococcota bacterium]|nr:NAD(P)H-binding protein [Myxococcota bacterium]
MSDARAALGRVLVTGANGNLGRALIGRLLAGAAPGAAAVVAVVRSERAAATVRALAAKPEVAVVDYGDSDALARAARGCDGAVHLVGILKEAPGTSYQDAHEGAARALAAAAPRAGCNRVVYLSILGAGTDSPNACLASKARAEAILLAAPLRTTVLRVPMVLGGDDYASLALRARAHARFAPMVGGGASLEQPIDLADVVEAIVAALARPGLAGRVLDLAGPESLPRRALVRRAAALAGARGPTVLPIPLTAARLFAALAERLSANPPLTPAMLGVLEHDDHVDPG